MINVVEFQRALISMSSNYLAIGNIAFIKYTILWPMTLLFVKSLLHFE